MQPRPDRVNICGIDYTITYVDKPSDVDIYKRKSLWGQIDFWTRSIRIYDNRTTDEDVLQTLLHEVLHGIANDLRLDILDSDDAHDELDVLALALTDVFIRNNWITLQKESQ
jgi:hypothetical protein